MDEFGRICGTNLDEFDQVRGTNLDEFGRICGTNLDEFGRNSNEFGRIHTIRSKSNSFWLVEFGRIRGRIFRNELERIF